MSINEKILQLARDLDGKYFTAKQLRGILQVKSTAERQIVAQALEDLQNSNEIVYDQRNRRYRIVDGRDFGTAVFECKDRKSVV